MKYIIVLAILVAGCHAGSFDRLINLMSLTQKEQELLYEKDHIVKDDLGDFQSAVSTQNSGVINTLLQK
jgi:hypothetical protein